MVISPKNRAKHWRDSAERSWLVSKDLLKAKHYDACLFFCHLSIEKLLKGLVLLGTKKESPHIHDLVRLAELAKLELPENKFINLKIITTFNIAGRYEEEKYSFYKKCTPAFTKKHFLICQEIFLWLKKEYHQK